MILRSRTFGTLVLIVAGAALSAACAQTPPAASTDPGSPASDARDAPTATAATTAAAAAPTADPRLATASTLALSDPGGSALVDNEIRGLQKRLAKAPQHVDWWIYLGRAWITKARELADPGYYLNARACADMVLDFAPGSTLAKNLIGQALLNDHEFAKARDVAEEVLAKDPEDVLAWGTLSDARMEMGRHDGAIEAANRMVELKPSLPSYSRVSYLSWLRGDVPTALQAIKLAAESGKDPNYPEPRAWTLVQAAMIFWHQGDHEGAEAGFKTALDELSEYPPALAGMGRVAMARGDAKKAAEYFERAHRQSPLVDTAWRLGDARAAAGDEAGAAAAYATAIKDGRRGDHRTLALFFAVKNRDLDEALTLAKSEMEQRPGVYTRDAYAWALYRKGQLPEARAQIDEATRLGTKDAQLLYHAGAIRIAMGERPAGEKLVRRALALNPRFDPTGAPEAEALLAGK